MKRALCFFSAAAIIFSAVPSASLDIAEVVKKSDEVMRGKTSRAAYQMVIQTPRWERTVEMQVWSEGTEKSFIKITYPKRDSGTTFLKLKNEMWQYIPKVEKTIKIPPSMMLQSWLGSDFTNDDLVKESSIVEDYTARLVSEDAKMWKIELLPKEQAAVSWEKLLMWVDKKTYVPVREEFFDEEGKLVRILLFEDITELPGRSYPMKFIMLPQTEDKAGHKTVFITKTIVFDEPVDQNIFSLKSLQALSR